MNQNELYKNIQNYQEYTSYELLKEDTIDYVSTFGKTTKLNEDESTLIYQIVKYLMNKNTEYAIEICQLAIATIKTDRDYIYFYNLLGNIQRKESDMEAAIASYNKAIEYNKSAESKYEFVKYNLVKVYQLIHLDKEKGLSDWDNIDPKEEIKQIIMNINHSKYRLYAQDILKNLGEETNVTSREANLLYTNNYINDLIDKLDAEDIKDKLHEFQEEVLKLKAEKRITTAKVQGNDCFYHYTPMRSMDYLIPANGRKDNSEKVTLRMYNAVHLNDPEEGMVLINILKQKASSQGKELLNKIYFGENYYRDENTYILSFTKKENDCLPLWVHYGARGNGYVISFEKDAFDLSGQPDAVDFGDDNTSSNCLYEVEYIDEKRDYDFKKIHELFDAFAAEVLEIEDACRIIKILLDQVRYCYKSETYRYENEVRIIKFAESNSCEIDRVQFDEIKHHNMNIKKMYIGSDVTIKNEKTNITLGPNVKNKREVAAYLYQNNIKDVKISKIQYK